MGANPSYAANLKTSISQNVKASETYNPEVKICKLSNLV
jgi:hypothetical protein